MERACPVLRWFPMPTRQIATSTLWQIASQVTMAALSILTVKFVYVGLSTELVGNYNSAYGFLQLFGILADFGLYAVGVREMSRAQDRSRVLGALIVLRSGILVLSLAAALLLVWIVPTWRGTPLPMGVTIAALVPFFTLLAGVLRTIFQVTYRMHFVFVAEVTQRIITTGLIGLFIWMGTRNSQYLYDYYDFLFTGGIGAGVLFLLSLYYGNKIVPVHFAWDETLIRKLAREALPFGLAFLCMALYRQMDATMIALLRPDFDVQNAYYGSVLRMVEMGYIIPTFLLNSVLPTLSERDANGTETRSLLGRTLLVLLMLGAIASLFALLWPRALVRLLTTEAYLSTATAPGSDTALRLMAAPLLLNGLIQYGYYVLLTRGRWRPLVGTLAAAALLSFTLNMLWIPARGFVGAAETAIAVHVFLVLVLLPSALRAMPASIKGVDLIRIGAFSALLAGTLLLVEPLLTDPVRTFIGLILAGPVLLLLAALTGLPKVVR